MIPPAVIERGVEVAEGAHVGSLVVLGQDVTIGAGTHRRARGDPQRHRDRRGLRAARLHRRRRLSRRRAHPITGGAVLGEGVTVGADNVIAARRAYLPWCDAARRRDQVLAHRRGASSRWRRSTIPTTDRSDADERRRRRAHRPPRTLSREAIARVDASGQLDDVLALPEHLRDALWRVESAIMEEWDTPAGLVVAGMGGSAIGGALARAALGDHASRPIFVTRAYGLPPGPRPRRRCCAPATPATPRRRSPATSPRARWAPSAWSSPPAGAWPRWRARTACR